jgi:hypothetical protein
MDERISPTIDEWELGAHYTLLEQDLEVIRQRRKDANRIGYAVQLCVLRHTGWPLSEIQEVPYRVLHFAAGRLTRDWNEQTSRSENDQVAKALFTKTEEADRKVAERVTEVAVNRGIPRAQVALAWLLQKEEVTAPIIGATKMSHLEDAVSALSVKLTSEEIRSLEELYVPHPLV